MSSVFQRVACAAVLLLVLVVPPAQADHPGQGEPNLGKSCDRASSQGLKSKAHAHCIQDRIIDADGIDSPGDGVPAAVEVQRGDALTPFPDSGRDAGLDMFDQDGSGTWTDGDDLHVEDPSACATAVRNGIHDLGDDCKVLDLNGDLADGDRVDCDISFGFSFSGMPCPPTDVKFHDADGNGAWTPGEDIVQDTNGNNIYD